MEPCEGTSPYRTELVLLTCRDSVMLLTMRRWMPRIGTRWSPFRPTPPVKVVEGALLGAAATEAAAVAACAGCCCCCLPPKKASTSSFRMRPLGPVPRTLVRSSPFSFAILRTAGVVRILLPWGMPALRETSVWAAATGAARGHGWGWAGLLGAERAEAGAPPAALMSISVLPT